MRKKGGREKVSKQAWKVMMAILITLGVIVSLLFILPGAPWRSSPPREIPLALPGEKIETHFFELSLEDFQHLSLESTYYSIYVLDSHIIVKALGFEDGLFYRAEGEYEFPFGFEYSSRYSGDTLILSKTVSLLSYLEWTIVIAIIVGLVCTIIGVITYPKKMKS
ncbi:MAG: hypothetical protein MUP45_01155 [Candidatus Marinimicrobia bacterium]|nr:hypothetical protein [Candidatus Neomarinimicrobiota bacterium]